MIELALVLMAIGFVAKTAGGAVAHGAAAVRGKPSPTVEKWQAREKARQAAGLPSRPTPRGPFSTAWQNSVEKWVTKSEQRHYGRMQALRSLGPKTASKAEKRALRKAEFRARLAAKSASWFGTGRDRMQRISRDLREVVAEKRAQRAAEKSGAAEEEPSRQEQAAAAVADLDKAKQDANNDGSAENGGTGATILVFPFANQSTGASAPGTSSPQNGEGSGSTENNGTSENTGGDQQMSTQTGSTITATQQQTTTEAVMPEPTDLPTSIRWADAVGGHVTNLGNKMTDDAAICQNNAEHMGEQAAKIEGAKAALADLGFAEGGTVQFGLAKAQELAPAAAATFTELERLSRQLSEQLTEISGALSEVKGALEGQQGLADEAQSQNATAGVAKDTRFYLEG